MATAFNVSVAPSGGDYTSLQSAIAANACDLTAAATKVFSHGAITGTMSANTAVVGVISGATGTCVVCTTSQILIKSITGTFQSGEVVYETLGTNLITISNAGDSPSLSFNISGTWVSADTTTVNITGYTTNSTNSISIATSGSAKNTTGIYSTSFYRLEHSGSGVDIFAINNDNITITGLQVKQTSNGFGFSTVKINANHFNILLDSCILIASDGRAYRNNGTGASCQVRNTIGINQDSGGGGLDAMASAGPTFFYNCVGISYGSGSGLSDQSSGFHGGYENCYAYSASGSAYVMNNFTMITCASNDGTGNITVAYSTSTFTGVTLGSEILSLVSGSSLILAGTNMIGTFSLDITGATRQSSGAWDIGAFLYVSSGGVNTTNFFPFFGN